MSRRYNKELALESGTPLGIAPRSDYSRVVTHDSAGRIISRDMKTVGDDIRRSEGRIYADYIVKGGKKIPAPKGGKWVITTSGNISDVRGKPEAKGLSFDRYAKLYWATKG